MDNRRPGLTSTSEHNGGALEVVRAGIDTYQESVVYMHEECPVCRSEGFEAQARIKVSVEDRSIIATLNVVSGDWLRRFSRPARDTSSQRTLCPMPRMALTCPPLDQQGDRSIATAIATTYRICSGCESAAPNRSAIHHCGRQLCRALSSVIG